MEAIASPTTKNSKGNEFRTSLNNRCIHKVVMKGLTDLEEKKISCAALRSDAYLEVTTPPRCSTGVSCDFGGVTIQRSYPVVLCIRVSRYVLSLVLVGVLGIRETMGDVAIRNAKKIRFRYLLGRFRFFTVFH